MQIELEQTGTEDGWNESWRRGMGMGLDGEGGGGQLLKLQQQITNIRQVFLNSGAAAQSFSLSLVFLYSTSGYLGNEYAA